jgi:hypothetical protein
VSRQPDTVPSCSSSAAQPLRETAEAMQQTSWKGSLGGEGGTGVPGQDETPSSKRGAAEGVAVNIKCWLYNPVSTKAQYNLMDNNMDSEVRCLGSNANGDRAGNLKSGRFTFLTCKRSQGSFLTESATRTQWVNIHKVLRRGSCHSVCICNACELSQAQHLGLSTCPCPQPPHNIPWKVETMNVFMRPLPFHKDFKLFHAF